MNIHWPLLLQTEADMKVKNISARLHHIGEATCIPGEITEIGDEFVGCFNAEELEVVEDIVTPPKSKAKNNTKEMADNPFAQSK